MIQSALCDFDRQFGSFFGDSFFAPRTATAGRVPAVDARETEKAYTIEMELPGHDENSIEIHLDGNSLSVASRQEETAESGGEDRGTWLLRERRVSSFSRSFKVPQNADAEKVSAVFRNGVLSIEMQKKLEAQRRTVRINAG